MRHLSRWTARRIWRLRSCRVVVALSFNERPPVVLDVRAVVPVEVGDGSR